MAQSSSKTVYVHSNAKKEIEVFPKEVRHEIDLLVVELGDYGTLKYPEGKKLLGYDLFEMRVPLGGAFRCFYCYFEDDIVILSAFQKKSQKTPKREIQKALKRRRTLN
jgi:phage-related protein